MCFRHSLLLWSTVVFGSCLIRQPRFSRSFEEPPGDIDDGRKISLIYFLSFFFLFLLFFSPFLWDGDGDGRMDFGTELWGEMMEAQGSTWQTRVHLFIKMPVDSVGEETGRLERLPTTTTLYHSAIREGICHSMIAQRT